MVSRKEGGPECGSEFAFRRISIVPASEDLLSGLLLDFRMPRRLRRGRGQQGCRGLFIDRLAGLYDGFRRMGSVPIPLRESKSEQSQDADEKRDEDGDAHQPLADLGDLLDGDGRFMFLQLSFDELLIPGTISSQSGRSFRRILRCRALLIHSMISFFGYGSPTKRK